MEDGRWKIVIFDPLSSIFILDSLSATLSIFLPRNFAGAGLTENSVQSWHRRWVFCHHLMTLSARYSKDCGIVRPICFAVLRLITNSNFVGCSTGRSAGLAPFRILSTKYATRR
jgi:hypothetical protein